MKVNKIAPLEFELTYYDVAVQYINHYTTGTLSTYKKEIPFIKSSIWCLNLMK